MKKLKLACIVVLYNPSDKELSNINNYINLVDKLYLIDNSDDKIVRIKPNNKIEYDKFYENKGMAYALNFGASKAIKDGFQWLLTLDQDSHLTAKELNEMAKFINTYKENDIGLVSPWHVIKTGVKKPETMIDYPIEVMTSGNIVNLKAYQEVGGWDNNLFIDDVDIDFCMNLQLHNYKVIRLDYVEMEHSLGNIEIKHLWPLHRDYVCSNHNYVRRYYMARNVYYLANKYHGAYADYFAFMKRGLQGQVKNIIVFEKDKYRKIRNILRGKRDAQRNIMGKYPYED
jgi:rhamnosyltransferase